MCAIVRLATFIETSLCASPSASTLAVFFTGIAVLDRHCRVRRSSPSASAVLERTAGAHSFRTCRSDCALNAHAGQIARLARVRWQLVLGIRCSVDRAFCVCGMIRIRCVDMLGMAVALAMAAPRPVSLRMPIVYPQILWRRVVLGVVFGHVAAPPPPQIPLSLPNGKKSKSMKRLGRGFAVLVRDWRSRERFSLVEGGPAEHRSGAHRLSPREGCPNS